MIKMTMIKPFSTFAPTNLSLRAYRYSEGGDPAPERGGENKCTDLDRYGDSG
jgi:hypothetical protein